MKAESKRMEALMKKLALQQVQQEKDEGEARLTEALEQAKKEFEIEKADVAKKSKAEGIAETQNQIQIILAQEEAKRKKIILNAEREKQVSLIKLECIQEIIFQHLRISLTRLAEISKKNPLLNIYQRFLTID